jgi:hypothetical protein
MLPRGGSVSKVIYRITYPNGKVYIGMDLTGTLLYFGSVNGPLVEADFTPDQRQSFTIRKDILWESEDAPDSEVRRREVEFIRELRSNDTAVGYNRWPRLHPPDETPEHLGSDGYDQRSADARRARR